MTPSIENSEPNIKPREQATKETAEHAGESNETFQQDGINTHNGASNDVLKYSYHISFLHEQATHIETGNDITPYEYRFLSPETVAKMQAWVDDIPSGCGLADPGNTRNIDVNVLKEWMNWSKYSALAWIQKLDEFERRFRLAALEYHKVPYTLRHASTLLHGFKIDHGTLTRLKQILENDRPRSQQFFFITWLQIYDTAIKVMIEVNLSRPFSDDAAVLHDTLDRFHAHLGRLSKPLRILEMGLAWLEAAIAQVVSRCPATGTEQLEAKHSREGILFRQWIQSLPEIEYGLVKSSQYTEFYVEQLLDIGVEREPYWSMLIKGGRAGKVALVS